MRVFETTQSNMTSTEHALRGEHFVTLFDHRFLLQGLALYESLMRNAAHANLWVLCLDDVVVEQLARLQLPNLRPLSLRELETPGLLRAKADRSRVEYIYTLTPFAFDFVFAAAPDATRVTYVDADVYFFRDPAELLHDLAKHDREILITEHGYAPEFQSRSEASGRFCVQFLTISRSPTGLEILRTWQQQCLQSCSTSRIGRREVFGDQRYLEAWPEQYPNAVCISPRVPDLLAPWNVAYYQSIAPKRYDPVLYHFHSLRLFHPRWVQLCAGYDLHGSMHLYEKYLQAFRRNISLLKEHQIPHPTTPLSGDRLWPIRLAWRLVTGRANVCRFHD